MSELFWQGDGSTSTPFYLCAATHGRGIWRSNFPILSGVYVDKNHTGLENGTIARPYNTFQEALVAAGHGSEIIFKSSGDHEEIPASAAAVIADKRITITLENNGTSSPLPVVIK